MFMKPEVTDAAPDEEKYEKSESNNVFLLGARVSDRMTSSYESFLFEKCTLFLLFLSCFDEDLLPPLFNDDLLFSISTNYKLCLENLRNQE